MKKVFSAIIISFFLCSFARSEESCGKPGATSILSSKSSGVISAYSPSSLMNTENQADYLVIAPADFADALEPLMDHRTSGGLKVALATTAAIADEFGLWGTGTIDSSQIEAFVRYAYFKWQAPAPKYLLIAGDAPAPGAKCPSPLLVPTGLVYSIYDSKNYNQPIASDVVYADIDGDGIPEIATGRMPADTPEELISMIDKTIRYETSAPPGDWRTRLSFFASEGHFGAIDKVLEKLFKLMIRNNVGPQFELNMTYANPKHPCMYAPEKFNDKVIERFNDGSLIMTYIGHGLTDKFDSVHWLGKKYPIMTMKDVASLDCGGRSPFLLVIACLVGNYDTPEGDSIGEIIFKNPGGPAGVIAASVVSQPYSNGVLTKTFAEAVFKDREPTIGMALLMAKKYLLSPPEGDERKLLERFGRAIYTEKDMARHNRETVFMYNLLGDPATKIAMPPSGVTIDAPESADPGALFKITGKVSGISDGEVALTLSAFSTDFVFPLKDISPIYEKMEKLSAVAEREESGEGSADESKAARAELDKLTVEFLDIVEENYFNSNNRNVWVGSASLKDGGFFAYVRVPDWIPRKKLYIRAYASGGGVDSMGFREIKIMGKPAAEDASGKDESEGGN